MILQDAFQDNGYTDLLAGYEYSKREKLAQEYGFHLEDFFDSEKEQPKELLGIFISKQRDDLFFLLKADSDINQLCDDWDNQIRVFTIMNRKSRAFQKFQYNIVQLIVYTGDEPDGDIQGNLLMSRKILIKGTQIDDARIVVDDTNAVDLPFHMIPAEASAQDLNWVKQQQELRQLLPDTLDLWNTMIQKRKQVNRSSSAKKQPTHYTGTEFNDIKEWLER